MLLREAAGVMLSTSIKPLVGAGPMWAIKGRLASAGSRIYRC